MGNLNKRIERRRVGEELGHVLHLIQSKAETGHARFHFDGYVQRAVGRQLGKDVFDGVQSLPVVNEGNQTFFHGESDVFLIGNEREQGDDVAGKARISDGGRFFQRSCRRPAYAELFQRCGCLQHAVPVGVGFDDGHQAVPFFI